MGITHPRLFDSSIDRLNFGTGIGFPNGSTQIISIRWEKLL
jgi:hypothetical protein